jgi:predicted ABC-type ATPase
MVKELRPVLCVVAGPNGSGKTSTTEKLLANFFKKHMRKVSLSDSFMYVQRIQR